MAAEAAGRHHNIHSVWQLRSEPLLLKFLGPLGAALGAMLALLLASFSRPAAPIAVVPAPRPVLASLRAMRLHASQWVWFRWLFVGLSSYGWVNVLERVV
jgi:N-acetylglucosaminylphosphatidylinositol deacetylase